MTEQQPSDKVPEEEFDEISDLFFGKLKSIRSFTSDGVTKNLEDRDEKFFNVLLKVYQENEMYTAWDKDHREFLDNFEPAHGQPRVQLKITNWIQKLPEILIL